MVHRSSESQDRVFLLQVLSAQVGRFVYPVHRLDRAASGVIVFAFSSEDARLLQGTLNADDAKKEYLVLVRGSTPERWEVDRPLKNEAGVQQAARSSFERIAEFFRLSLLRATIFTGRRHQIRRHLARSAHQVIGDSSYGKGKINRFFRETYGLPRLFLHATLLELRHPRTEKRMALRAPLPEDLRDFLKRLPDYPAAIVATL